MHRLSNDPVGAYALLDYLVTTGTLPDSLHARAEASLAGLDDARQCRAALRARQAGSQPPP